MTKDRVEAVLHMGSREVDGKGLAQAGQQMEQNGGIEPAAQPDAYPPGWPGKLVPAAGNPRREVNRRQFP